MFNSQVVCLKFFFCVLFIPSTLYAQTDTIIEKVFESETRAREHVDKKVEGIETKIDNLDTKIGTLSNDVIENKTNIENMKETIRELKGTVDRIWYGILGILGTLILSIVGYFFKSWRVGRGKADNMDAVERLTEQITNLTSAQAETSAHITKLIAAQMEVSPKRNVPGHPNGPILDEVGELIDDIRSERYD